MPFVRNQPGDADRYTIRWIDEAYASAPAGAAITMFLREEELEWPSVAKRRAKEILASRTAYADIVEIEHSRSGVWGNKSWTSQGLTEVTPTAQRAWKNYANAISSCETLNA